MSDNHERHDCIDVEPLYALIISTSLKRDLT